MPERKELYANILAWYVEQLTISYANFVNAQLTISEITPTQADKKIYTDIKNTCRFWFIQTRIKLEAIKNKLDVLETEKKELEELTKKIEQDIDMQSFGEYTLLVNRIFLRNANPELLTTPSKEIGGLGV